MVILVEMKEYILELLYNRIWVFPIKGKGRKLEEAKEPLTFFEGDEKVTWKNEKILAYTEELARKGHEAWGVWLLKSNRFGVDIDLYKAKEELNVDLVRRLKEHPELYTEISGRGGVHILLEVDSNSKYTAVSPFKWVEWKHDGHFIIAPSVLKTPKKVYKYTRISGSLLVTIPVELWNDKLGNEVLPELNIKIYKNKGISIPAGINPVTVTGVNLNINIDELTNEQITALMYLLFHTAGCVGISKVLEWIGEYNVVPIRKQMYNLLKIPRTTRWLLQYELAAVMAYLGFSPERTAEWLASWKFVDEDSDPRADSLQNAILNAYSGKLLLLPRGTCPFCSLAKVNNESCFETPIHKVFKLHSEEIKKIVDFVKRHVN